MELHEALYTTRAMRRVRPDPIPFNPNNESSTAAVRAPSGGNQQNWRFLLLDDPAKKAALAPLYRQAMGELWKSVYKDQLDAPPAPSRKLLVNSDLQGAAVSAVVGRQLRAGAPLPLSLQPARPDGSLYLSSRLECHACRPRAEGIGSCLTALLQFFHPDETLEILGVPIDEGWILSATVSFGYPTGTWGVGARTPVHEVSYRNTWSVPVGFEVCEPLWPG